MTTPEEILQMLYGPADESSRGTLRRIMGWTLEKFRDGNILDVDAVLERLDVSKVLPIFVSALLRATGMQRRNLPHWNSLRDEAFNVLGDVPLLRGLRGPEQLNPWGPDMDRIIGVHATLRR